MDMNAIESSLLKVLEEFAQSLPRQQVSGMRELVIAGEAGVAFENLCTQIFEYDLIPTGHILDQLQQIGIAMGINSKYWERLKPTA